MDPITQGLLGAAVTQAVLGRRLGKRAWLVGAIGGMAADLDVLIRSPSDPLVGWQFHRHFTHSVAFIPFGGVLASLPWILRKRFATVRRDIIAGTTVGYATHALLDAFTSYGTMLWWPLSDMRVAWSWISIVDPIYTGILGIGVVLAARRLSMRPARIALLLSSLYMVLGFVQRARVLDATQQLATSRGHTVERIDAYPAPPTNLMWRTTYLSEGRVYISQARAPWWSPVRVRPGESVELVTEPPAAIAEDPATREGFEVFQWFARGWVGWDPKYPDVLADLRYGLVGGSASSMWGVQLRPGQSPAVQSHRGPMEDAMGPRWRDLLGDGW
ncbi:MAG: metal-dependent hydrolase [Deltaproteobacteria bacterium]|nr:metal-dependent hydrolase [Deltaproteobacteria bacterium]